jgi:hypothetical protein
MVSYRDSFTFSYLCKTAIILKLNTYVIQWCCCYQTEPRPVTAILFLSFEIRKKSWLFYRVIKEELPPLTEVISDDILSKKCHINLCPTQYLQSYVRILKQYCELRVAFANVST